MKTERVQKYYKLLKVIAKKKEINNKEFYTLVKEHKCSTSIGTILCNGGVMKKLGRTYHWVSPVCTIDTTVKALANLHTYNQASYQRRKSRKNLEQEFIATMPKAKVKKHESYNSGKIKSYVSVLWGLYTKTVYS
jgi:hypothetical protein